jgi:hypothetical protein
MQIRRMTTPQTAQLLSVSPVNELIQPENEKCLAVLSEIKLRSFLLGLRMIWIVFLSMRLAVAP